MARGDDRFVVQLAPGELSQDRVNIALRRISEEINSLLGRSGKIALRNSLEIFSTNYTSLLDMSNDQGGAASLSLVPGSEQVEEEGFDTTNLALAKGAVRNDDAGQAGWIAKDTTASILFLDRTGFTFNYNLDLVAEDEFAPSPFLTLDGDDASASLCGDLLPCDASTYDVGSAILPWQYGYFDAVVTPSISSASGALTVGGAASIDIKVNGTSFWGFDLTGNFLPSTDDNVTIGDSTHNVEEIYGNPLGAKYRCDSLAAWTPPTGALANAFVLDTTVYETNTAVVDMQTVGGSANTGITLGIAGYYRGNFNLTMELANNAGHSIYVQLYSSGGTLKEYLVIHTQTNVTGSTRVFVYTGSFTCLAAAGDYITFSTDGSTIGVASDNWNTVSIERLN